MKKEIMLVSRSKPICARTLHILGIALLLILGDNSSAEAVNSYLLNTDLKLDIRKDEIHFNQQQVKVTTVSGLVTDDFGEPLPGVTVLIKGTTNGTTTNIDGKYTLSGIERGNIIQFSFVGMKTHEVIFDTQMTINVQLLPDAIGLQEVVAVGYGIQKKASVTGSVTSISSEELQAVKATNITNTLAGKLPGLRAVQRSGSPGDDNATIDIRGFGTPLVIVDGIERDFAQIDPNDIESISILKDASASVYGFKGANGVVLITTKRG